jgi:ABC-type multidrug transport system fused ATPase/permease subunit
MNGLPIASASEVRSYARRLTVRYPRQLLSALALHAVATGVGLVAPWLLGQLVEDVQRGNADITRTVVLIGVCVTGQAVLTCFAVRAAAQLGERVLAELREGFVRDVLALRLADVERAGTGDLVTRTTRDINALSSLVRTAVPDSLVALSTLVIALGALVLVDPLVAFPGLVAVPILWAAARWYLSRSRAGYLRENAAYSQLTEGLTETVLGARTVETLRIADRRTQRADDDIAEVYAAERYTLRLRSLYLPIVDTAYMVPVVATLIIGGFFYLDGRVELSAITAATLYMQQLATPIDLLLARLDELQVGAASLARLLGVRRRDPAAEGSTAPVERVAADRSLASAGQLTVAGVSYAYRSGHDVLHDVSLVIKPGERLAIVGPSGAGKTTLGRLLAGIEAPRTGSVTVDEVPLTALSLSELRTQVALVTQEYHVFAGTLRDNVVLGRPEASAGEIEHALAAVDALDWVLDIGLDAAVGNGGVDLSPSQAQQLSLARLVLADPHTLVLDEATSMLDPRAARHLERSLAAVIKSRTVVAIAHRLHTAHDADRIAVMDHGRIVELGSHDELVRRGGAYAALWRSWHGGRQPAPGQPRPARSG